MLARVGLFRGTAQTVKVRCTQARSALGTAKHTHRHRAPPLVGPNVYLDFKGMGRNVMESMSPPSSSRVLLL